MTWFFVVFVIMWATFLGACCGGFASVVEYRTLARVSLTRPSQCGACGATLKMWEILPVVGWFIVRGKCRTCRARIPTRDLAIEASSTALFIATTATATATSATVFDALQRIGVGLGVAATTLGLWIMRRVHARKSTALPKRTCAVGALLSLAWFAATPWNPLALIARFQGINAPNDIIFSLVITTAFYVIVAVLALTLAFEWDLRANLNRADVTTSEFDGHDDGPSSNWQRN